MLNSRNTEIASGNELTNSQNLAFPILLFVASIILPMNRSEIPSNTLESIRIVPMVAAFAPTTLAK